jgi:hypothetical protein
LSAFTVVFVVFISGPSFFNFVFGFSFCYFYHFIDLRSYTPDASHRRKRRRRTPLRRPAIRLSRSYGRCHDLPTQGEASCSIEREAETSSARSGFDQSAEGSTDDDGHDHHCKYHDEREREREGE